MQNFTQYTSLYSKKCANRLAVEKHVGYSEYSYRPTLCTHKTVQNCFSQNFIKCRNYDDF